MPYISVSDPTIETFENNIEINHNRYTVCLPWRSGLQLTDSGYYMAKKRLGLLKKSLTKAEKYKAYDDVINSYLSKDYIEKGSRSSERMFYSASRRHQN